MSPFPLRSNLQDIVGGENPEGQKPSTMLGEQWLGTLRNQGVKQDELSSIEDWLRENSKRHISSPELHSRISESTPRVQERWKTKIGSDDEVASEDPFITHFDKYQIPGGKNYRELLLTLPPRSGINYAALKAEHLGGSYWRITKPDGQSVDKIAFDPEDAKDSAMKHWGHQDPNFYTEHWDETNPLAHLRMNDRSLTPGDKTLLLEELQSDWHQQGRKKGYAADPKIMKRGMVPDAPFKKTWPELLLKRALHHAIEHGYHNLAWTGGQTQVDRYPELEERSKDGLRGFYDTMLPRMANKLFGKHGAKVEQHLLNGSHAIHVLPITLQLRDHVKKHGLTMFGVGGRV